MKIVTYTSARDTLRSVLDSVVDSKPVIIKSKASAAVLMDYNQYLDLMDRIKAEESK